METLADFIPTIEALLAWAKEHPELPMEYPEMRLGVHFPRSDAAGQKEAMRQWTLALGSVVKQAAESTFWVRKNFTPFSEVIVFADREAVCRKVVETFEEPEQIIPAQPAKPEQIIPARTREVVRWDCQPILASVPELSNA